MRCRVCGQPIPTAAELNYEQETYTGAEGAEMKLTVAYCGSGKGCNPIEAANLMDKIAEPFYQLVGRRW